jgi:hypothetical protein
MNNYVLYYLGPILIGAGATLTIDIWALLLKHVFKIPPSNFCLVGRWLRYLPKGIFRHSNIGAAQKMSAECAVGWIAHYVTGVTFAIIFIAFTGKDWLQQPTLTPAVAFGFVTVSIPFFIMQPAFGLGIAASKTPNPAQARGRSLINHIIFGLGLYLYGLLVSRLL